jgi:DNA polymerase-3 subunit delta
MKPFEHLIRQRRQAKGPGIAGDATRAAGLVSWGRFAPAQSRVGKAGGVDGHARPISADDVRALVSAALDANIFAMVDTLGLRDAKRAMAAITGANSSGANELYLLAMIARQFRLILSVKDLAQNRGLQQEDIRKELKISHSFFVEKLARQGSFQHG